MRKKERKKETSSQECWSRHEEEEEVRKEERKEAAAAAAATLIVSQPASQPILVRLWLTLFQRRLRLQHELFTAWFVSQGEREREKERILGSTRQTDRQTAKREGKKNTNYPILSYAYVRTTGFLSPFCTDFCFHFLCSITHSLTPRGLRQEELLLFCPSRSMTGREKREKCACSDWLAGSLLTPDWLYKDKGLLSDSTWSNRPLKTSIDIWLWKKPPNHFLRTDQNRRYKRSEGKPAYLVSSIVVWACSRSAQLRRSRRSAPLYYIIRTYLALEFLSQAAQRQDRQAAAAVYAQLTELYKLDS